MRNKFELLAPAGSLDILKGVIEAGADAVYLGGRQYGARAYADNFSEEELLEALDFAHLRNRRVYLTVNTLLKEQELSGLKEYLRPLYLHGLDAVIVQDFGAAAKLLEWFPDLAVHASTQMTVTGAEGVRLLQEAGFSRAVLSRELSLPEIQNICRQTGMELEIFVHGALCYCYSGQCLFSSMLGGRSGNRGRCAQPCRLLYSVLDEDGRRLLKDSYILSMKDLCAVDRLPQMADAGVYSLKIEGRMKQLSYAAGVVRAYRKYIDCFLSGQKAVFPLRAEEKKAIADLGSRCGFTDAYLDGENASPMITYEKPSFSAQESALQIPRSYLPIQGKLTLKKDEPTVLELTDGKHQVTVTGDASQTAKNQPLQKEDIRKRMEKTKDTAFSFTELEIVLPEPLFLSNGALNQLRRDGIAALERAVLLEYNRTMPEEEDCRTAREASAPPPKKNRIICAIEDRRQLAAVLEQEAVTDIYLSMDAYSAKQGLQEQTKDIARCHEADKAAFLIFPAVFREKTANAYTRMANELQNCGWDGAVVKNYEALWFVRSQFPQLPIVIDHNLYTYNREAVLAFRRLGIWRDTVPLELNQKELSKRDNTFSEMILYGYYPLMVSAQCVRKNAASCSKKTGWLRLKDRYGKEFPVRNCCRECYNVIYNSLPTLLFSHLEEIKAAHIPDFRLHFTVESAEEVRKICRLFAGFWTGKQKQLPKELQNAYTNGHYKRGVE